MRRNGCGRRDGGACDRRGVKKLQGIDTRESEAGGGNSGWRAGRHRSGAREAEEAT